RLPWRPTLAHIHHVQEQPMLAIIAAAMIHASWTAPAFGDTGDCKVSKRCPAVGDSVRQIVDVFPLGAYYRHWRDTLYVRRGEAIFYSHPAPILDLHLLQVHTA